MKLPSKKLRKPGSTGPRSPILGEMFPVKIVPVAPHPTPYPMLRITLQQLLFQIGKAPYIFQSADLVRDAVKIGAECQNALPAQFAHMVDVPEEVLHGGLFLRLMHELGHKGDAHDPLLFDQGADLSVLQIAPVRTDRVAVGMGSDDG